MSGVGIELCCTALEELEKGVLATGHARILPRPSDTTTGPGGRPAACHGTPTVGTQPPTAGDTVDVMARHQNPHLAVLGDRRAIGWVLTKQRIAFPEPRYRNLFPDFSSGDHLYLYTTRSAFGNPTNHRGRVIGAHW